MGSMDKGWISIHRKLNNNELWKSSDPFDKRSAWIDLLMMANYEQSTEVLDGKRRDILPGQILTSISALSRRWRWSRKKVRSYLGQMGYRQMTILEGHTRYCLITIVNWDFYQHQNKRKGHTKGTDKGTPISIYKQKETNKSGLEQQNTAPAEEENDDGMTVEEYEAWVATWESTDSTEKTQSDSSKSKG